MKFETGQIVVCSIPFENGTEQRKYVLISKRHDVLPIIAGYVINPLEKHSKVTDVPLVPNSENNIRADFFIDMAQEYIIDSRKAISIFGHLKDSEQAIIDSYGKIFSQNNLTSTVGVDELTEDLRNQYLLLCAVEADDSEAVREMLTGGINIDEYRLTTTLLHYAVKCDALKTADVIINNGDYIDSIDKDEKTPLCCAVENNNRNIAGLLVENGANPAIRVRGRSIYEIAKNDKMRQILKQAKREKKENEVLVMLKKEERAMSR